MEHSLKTPWGNSRKTSREISWINEKLLSEEYFDGVISQVPQICFCWPFFKGGEFMEEIFVASVLKPLERLLVSS